MISVDRPTNAFERSGCTVHPEREVVAVLRYTYSVDKDNLHTSTHPAKLCAECLLNTQFMISQFLLREHRVGGDEE
jgi:hypothetical protein